MGTAAARVAAIWREGISANGRLRKFRPLVIIPPPDAPRLNFKPVPTGRALSESTENSKCHAVETPL